MKRFRGSRWLLGSILFAGQALPLLAADVGDPIYPLDLDDKARMELIYEYMDRDMDQNIGSGDELKADVLFLRIHTDVGQHAYLDFDVGGIDVEDGNSAFYGGIGLRLLAYDGPAWRVNAMAQVHYAPNIDSSSSTNDLSFDLLEVDGGVFLSRKIVLDKQLTLLPYAGPILSTIQLNGDGDASEENIVGVAAGLSLLMPGLNSFRIETRYIDHASVSLAAGIAF